MNKNHLHRPNCQTILFPKKYILCRHQNFQQSSLTIFKNDKAKFKAVLRKYLNTHSFYSVDELFICKDDL